MTRHLWVLVVLPWDGFLVSFSVGLFPSGVGCRRLYCGSRIFVGRIETVESPLNWYRFFGNLMCQLCWDPSVFPIPEVDLFGWISHLGDPFDAVNFLLLRQPLGFCQPCVVETTSWFPEETNPLQTKFCVICRRSFSEFAVTRTFTDLSSVGSVEIHQIFLPRWISCSSELETGHCWGPSGVFWGESLRWTQLLDAVNGLLL